MGRETMLIPALATLSMVRVGIFIGHDGERAAMAADNRRVEAQADDRVGDDLQRVDGWVAGFIDMQISFQPSLGGGAEEGLDPLGNIRQRIGHEAKHTACLGHHISGVFMRAFAIGG